MVLFLLWETDDTICLVKLSARLIKTGFVLGITSEFGDCDLRVCGICDDLDYCSLKSTVSPHDRFRFLLIDEFCLSS